MEKTMYVEKNILKNSQIFLDNLKSLWEISMNLLSRMKYTISWLLQKFFCAYISCDKKYFFMRIYIFYKRNMKPAYINMIPEDNNKLPFRSNAREKSIKIRCFFPIMNLHKKRRKPSEQVLKVDVGEEKKVDQGCGDSEASVHHHEPLDDEMYYFFESMVRVLMSESKTEGYPLVTGQNKKVY